MIYIYILGANHHNTYGILRSLHSNSMKTHVLMVSKNQKCWFKKSRYCQNVSFFDDYDRMLDYLISIAQEFDYQKSKPIIIAASDAMATFVDSNQIILRKYFDIPGTNNQGS